MVTHKCKNPKFCPKCGYERRKKIVMFFEKHPDIYFSYKDIMSEFDFLNDWSSAQNVLENLERMGIVTRSYARTKHFTTGIGVKVYFKLNSNNLRKLNSNSWLKVF